MMKKTIIHESRLIKQQTKQYNVIFDLNGVLLLKTTLLDMLESQKEIATWKPVNSNIAMNLLKALKQEGHKLFILSNMSLAQLATLKEIPEISSLFSFFDDIIISEITPYQKPEPEIFQFLIDLHHLLPQDCVFIDDIQENIKAAQQAHIAHTILCKNFDLTLVKEQLKSLGVLQNSKEYEKEKSGQA